MPKFRDVKPNAKSMYWCNTGNKVVLANLIDEEIELFMLWSNQNLGTDWTPSDVKPGWYFKEELSVNLNFFLYP